MKWPPEKGEAEVLPPAISGKQGWEQYKSARGFAEPSWPMLPVQALRALDILREINRLRVLQAPIGRIFFGLEQRISQLTDEIERRAS